MTLATKMLGFASASGLMAALTIPAVAQTTYPNSTTTKPSTTTKQTQCPQGTMPSAQSTMPAPSSTTTSPSGTQTNPGAPPAPNSTMTTNQSGTTTQSTTGTTGSTTTTGTTTTGTAPNCVPTTAPATMQSPANGPGGMEMNAITNNPNGPNWMDKFNRPVARTSTNGMMMHYAGKHHKSKHRAKRASGGGH